MCIMDYVCWCFRKNNSHQVLNVLDRGPFQQNACIFSVSHQIVYNRRPEGVHPQSNDYVQQGQRYPLKVII